MNKNAVNFQTVKEDLCAATMLLTRIPVNWEKIAGDKEPDLNRCLWAYPIIGLVVALIGISIFWIAVQVNLPLIVAKLLGLIAMILSTGAFHEDGLADVADGFGGGLTKEQKLEIMRDSRIGTYGALALILAISLKLSSLSVLPSIQVFGLFIAASMMSRLMILYTLLILEPARKESLSVQAGKPSTNTLIVATLSALLITGSFIDPTKVIYIFIVSFVATLVMCFIAKRQIGGFSGDVLGAVQQISEIAIFVFLSAYWNS